MVLKAGIARLETAPRKRMPHLFGVLNNPAELSGFLISKFPGLSEKRAPGHWAAQVILTRAVTHQQARRLFRLVIGNGIP